MKTRSGRGVGFLHLTTTKLLAISIPPVFVRVLQLDAGTTASVYIPEGQKCISVCKKKDRVHK